MEKLSRFYSEVRKVAQVHGGNPMTVRHIESMIRIAQSSARMELRDFVSAKDVDNAIGIMLESFVQSQKHQAAEEIRRKFRRYVDRSVEQTELLRDLLAKLFDRKERDLLMRRGDEGAEPEELFVDLAQLQQEAERMDVRDVNVFLKSEAFET